MEGGLSVLGTSGIVEPMSQQAILDTIQLEMGQAALRAVSPRRLILAPGNYGLDYLHEKMPALKNIPVVKTSNFIGDTMDMAATSKFEQVVLVGHIGKLVKLAGGVMNTHSRTADCRTELLCAHAARLRRVPDVCAALMNAATTDACMEILDKAEMREPVLSSLLDAIQLHLDRRAAGAFRVARCSSRTNTARWARPRLQRSCWTNGKTDSTFYGVSVGPGDPELMTLQAVRRLESCPVIAAPQTPKRDAGAGHRKRCGGAERQDYPAAALRHEP